MAVERIRAASEAARATGIMLFARADGVMNGTYDMAEALRRARAFDVAGADGLYVPLPPNPEDLRRLCRATGKPVNALAAGPYARLTVPEFVGLGVARISLGSALARVTHRAIRDAARAMFEGGDFSPLMKGMAGKDVDRLLEQDPT